MALVRRQFLAGVGALTAGSAMATLSFAQGRGSIVMELRDARRLEGLAGNDLRRALLRSLTLRLDGADIAPVRLLAARFEQGRYVESFSSSQFEVRSGEIAFPETCSSQETCSFRMIVGLGAVAMRR